MIDLRSDTVTRPSAAMLEAMMLAPVGDDVFGEDPTVNALEERIARQFEQEAALFCPSGTMANQLAIAAQTRPLDEIIIDKLSHIYLYETAGYAFNSRVAVKLTDGDRGIMTRQQLGGLVNDERDWLAETSFLSIENTCNKGGGSTYSLQNMGDLAAFCREHELVYHLDGARIFNAMAVHRYTTAEFGGLFNSISVCFSKGLGAPAGSVLISSSATIRRARKLRKVMGGGMRQVGILAAACLFALDHNIPLLEEDHRRAGVLGSELHKLPYVAEVLPVETNIVMFSLKNADECKKVMEHLKLRGILTVPFGEKTVRMVTHLDFTDKMLDQTIAALRSFRNG